jgi:uncharacterized damage-inducible protein DinB
MLGTLVQTVLLRELAALRRSIEAYPDDGSLWSLPRGLPNSGGTLALHLAGNLRHYTGRVLGGSDYRRDREAEFSRRDVPRTELLAELDATRLAIEQAFAGLSETRLSEPYPEKIAGQTFTMEVFLVHLAAHLAYHLGQLDYHRRIVTGDEGSVGALAIGELPRVGGPT